LPYKRIDAQKLLHGARSHYPLSIAVLVAVFLLLGVITLMEKASRESDARKSPEALQFEKAPDGWLTHQKSVAEFRNALNAGNLSAVGLDGAEPGLVLYTLKSGEKASTIVPGCTVLGCAGTALDSLGDKSAQAGFALVRVEVDPRTASRRLLDILTGLLSPVLLVAALVALASSAFGCNAVWVAPLPGLLSVPKPNLRTPSAKKRQRPH